VANNFNIMCCFTNPKGEDLTLQLLVSTTLSLTSGVACLLVELHDTLIKPSSGFM
jgi:hypothetical protein